MEFKGLTEQQATESRKKDGSNALTEKKGESFWESLIGNFGDPMIKILIVALALNIIFYILKVAKVIQADVEWYESAGIAAAVLIATVVSTLSEFRNEQSFRKLQEEASRIKVKAYRDGKLTEILSDDVVKGDLIRLETGDKIPSDGHIIWGIIKVDQAALNGESVEAEKFPLTPAYTPPAEGNIFDNKTSVFRGSVVCSGAAVMEVDVVGDNTQLGKIAQEIQEDDAPDSPLKVKLSSLADGISKFGYIGGGLIAVAFFSTQMYVEGFGNIWNVIENIIEAVILAVIIIVMAVPEGLPLMIAIVSALNMGKMLKDNVLVRNREGIETAGSLNILFSDKTGTITKGKLETVLFADGKASEYSSLKDIPEMQGKILSAALLGNTTAVINYENNGSAKVLGGNATERAALSFVAGKSGAGDKVYSLPKTQTIASIPFSSTNKYSASQVRGFIDNKVPFNYTLIKGAPEKIIERCKYRFDENGKALDWNEKDKITEKIDELASRAIRVLAVAVTTENLDPQNDELKGENWIFVGVLGIRDEVRPESVTAIAEVKKAGVQVVMITGDRKDTAVAIAKDAGLVTSDKDITLTSDELAKLSDNEVKKMLPDLRVISRALPTDKSRLVRISQEMNLVVGMTGDGVNDSPALKQADVGFAMGGGTEVAKEASDIVILDDNFNSIDKAILYGRTIFNSIRKFIIFQLTINVAAVVTSFVAPFLGIGHPLSITQILWVNLVMDTLAALAFGGEPALKRFMNERPKKRDEAIVSKYMWSEILVGALVIFAIGLVFMKDIGGLRSEFFRPDQVKSVTETIDGKETTREIVEKSYWLTGYFAFFIFASVFNAFNARTDKINIFENINKNNGFLKILGVIVIIQVALTYLGGVIFNSYGLTGKEWIVVTIAAVVIIPVDMIRKLVIRKSA